MFIVETFSHFVRAVAHFTNGEMPETWRQGQGAFNLLVQVRPDLAELIRGSDIDPFNQDSNLTLFYDFVMRHWDD